MGRDFKQDFILSKSKYLAGLQCPKLLWTYYHAKEIIPPTDPATQALFDQGQQVTKLSHELFPAGVEVDGNPRDFEGLIKRTKELLSARKPIFEGAFRYKRSFARADVLSPNRDGSWDLYEVKSTTSFKDLHIPDVAFQKYCYEGSGLKIRRALLVYVNNQYVKDGQIDPKKLLVSQDISAEVEGYVGGVEAQIDRMVEILRLNNCPDIKIGLHCDEPHECALKDHCWSFLPRESVFILNRIRKTKAFELLESGVHHIKDIPKDFSLSPSQRIQHECHTKSRPKVDATSIKGFIEQIKFPAYFLDFETVGGAIPFYDHSRPYQQVPFQFSLHVLSRWGQDPAHHSYLARGKNDPRPELLAQLKRLIGRDGTILSYNMSFELGRLKECAEVYPDYETWFRSIEARFIDLIDPFRKFDYYHPDQMGRTSIKNVFPALTSGSYDGMVISDGGMASLQYARATFSDGMSDEERNQIMNGLEDYCKLDTQAMIDVLGVLRKACAK